jgi:MerR family copper efflux transcriptional regulator
MRIGELAKRAEVTARTIRYYEELGLIGQEQNKQERGEHDFHSYSEKDLANLHKIAALKQLGLSLEEVSSVLNLFSDQQTTPQARQKVLDLLQIHLGETEEKIAALQQFRLELQENIVRMQQRIIAHAQSE